MQSGRPMTTRAKLNVTLCATSILMLLSVFSKPLGVPETFEWVLTLGLFIPLGLSFYLIKKQKQEIREKPVTAGGAERPAAGRDQGTKRALILGMVLSFIGGLSSPFWMPLTGTTLGARGDLICGIIGAVIACAIFGFRLRRL
jgi:uncharacterized membrane protein YeaQ/YmgE (transglycosylase-associated protein family)